MSNYFNILNTGLRALQAQKKSLDTTAHNIANANTKGYSKQRAIHSATDPYTVPSQGMPTGAGQVGTGVEISEIERVKDQFVEGQIREKKQGQGYWDKKYEGLHRVELTFNEPSENSLSAAMDNFWKSLQDLSNNPEDTAVRSTVKERATTLADAFHSLDDQLKDYKRSLNRDVNTTVDEINSLAKRISDLNGQIVHIKGADKNPNDLMDQRDNLIEKLNKKVNVQAREDNKGNINISLGGIGLVSGDETNELVTEKVADSKYEDKIVFSEMNIDADINNGELKAIKELRNETVSTYRSELDDIAEKFADKFNDAHSEGYDLNGSYGQEFFKSDSSGGITADSITVSGIIENDLSKIAAGSLSDNHNVATVSGSYNGDEYKITVEDNGDYTIENLSNDTVTDETGNITPPADIPYSGLDFSVKGSGSATIGKGSGSGGNALNLSEVIKTDKIFNSGESTTMDKYQSVISSLGVKGQRANQMVSNQETLVSQLENQRQSISGVSLDEEMSNMIKYQQAYNAAAKLISNSNRMLDSLMSILR